MSDEAPPDHVFLRRPAPREGETTIVEISWPLFELLRDQLSLFRQLADRGTSVPIVATCDTAGAVDEQTLAAEGLRNARSTTAVLNYYSMNLRAGLTAGNYSRGVMLAHAVLGPDGATPTEELLDANGIVAWLADRERVVQVRAPNDGTDLTGERVIGLPIYSAAYVLAVFPPPRENFGRVVACGFEAGESGTWTMFESGDLIQRDREGTPMLEAPRREIEGELDRVRIHSDGGIAITLRGREYDLFKAPVPLYAAAVTQSVQFALTAHDQQTVLWDLYVGHAPQVIPVETPHTALAFSNGGELGLLGGADGSLTVVRLLPD